ncbi:MAG: bifunctional phosphopantothenoylcysteine decarboxylase/phosphopantothenate--cysteine ligase CoaBC [Bacillota bacterium]
MLGKRILVGITGGIAAYKAADIVSRLVKEGSIVQPVMTESAKHFIAPLTLSTLAGRPVLSDMFAERIPGVQHIDLAQNTDLCLIAPATANIIAKMALGIADDLLSTVLLAVSSPVVVAPAMNVNMYQHPAVQENLGVLIKRGVKVVEPDSGRLACGIEGKGRLADTERIIREVKSLLFPVMDLQEKTVLVTAGGTREAIDPVRYIGNRSSGKMGHAIAIAAMNRGARVILVNGCTSQPPPNGVEVIQVESAQDMYEAVLKVFDEADIVIKAAAVADYRISNPADHKIKKSGDNLVLELEPTIDILGSIGKLKKPHQIIIGFAAETDDLLHNALHKLRKKNLDLIVANDVTQLGAGFETDTNIAILLTKDGAKISLPMMTKLQLAHKILDQVLDYDAGATNPIDRIREEEETQ